MNQASGDRQSGSRHQAAGGVGEEIVVAETAPFSERLMIC